MVKDDRLMEDSIPGEILRRDALRELHKSLSVRRQIKHHINTLRKKQEEPSPRIGLVKMWKYTVSMLWRKIVQSVRDALHDYALWKGDLKAIEGIYGTGAGSYFRFLRYLFLLNICIAVIIAGFLLTPQSLYNHYSWTYETFSPQYFSPAPFSSPDHPTTEQLWTTDESMHTEQQTQYVPFGPLDWLTGAGWFNNTPLYYGGYRNGTFSLRSSGVQYDMSAAYLFTISACLAIYLGALMVRVIVLYRENYVDSTDGMLYFFTNKLFSAWDFNISDDKAASIKQRSIYNEFLELQQVMEEEGGNSDDNCCRKLFRLFLHVMYWLLLGGLMVLLGWSLYELLKKGFSIYDTESDEYVKESFQKLIFPIIVTALMGSIPIVFEAFARNEGYTKHNMQLYVTLLRIMLLELVILGVLVFFWYSNSPGLSAELLAEESLQASQLPLSNSTVYCWESSLGQEIYRLLMIDFLWFAVSSLIGDFLRHLIAKRHGAKCDIIQEFSIARSTLHLMYNQTLLWVGIFFCPLTPIIVSIKLFWVFYLQKFSAIHNLHPFERPWKAAQSETVFSVLSLISLILAFTSYVFILVRGYCSPQCGPLQGFVHYADLVYEVTADSKGIFVSIVSLLLKPLTVTVIICILSILVYFAKKISEGREESVRMLRKQLALEMQDRVFLLQHIEKIRKGEALMGSPQLHRHRRSSGEESHRKDILSPRASFVFSKTGSSQNLNDAEESICL